MLSQTLGYESTLTNMGEHCGNFIADLTCLDLKKKRKFAVYARYWGTGKQGGFQDGGNEKYGYYFENDKMDLSLDTS